MPDPSQLPLAGVRIVDLTTVIMGPMSTRVLGDLGADVIRVETHTPELMRNFVPSRSPGMSGVALNLHRNKRSVALDLKTDEGRRALHDIIGSANALVSNIRPAALERLGLGTAALRERYPSLVICNAVGFGSDGPYAGRAAYDDVIQSVSGLASMAAWTRGEPAFVPSTIADKVVALHITYAVLGALYRQLATGDGDAIEVPMAEAMASFNLVEHLSGHTFEPKEEPFSYLRIRTPNRKPRRSADGWICLLPYSDQNYRDLFTLVERPDLLDDPRFATANDRVANADDLYGILDTITERLTTDEWMAFCGEHSIPCMPVADLEHLDDDEHFAAVGLLELDEHPTEGAYRRVADPIRYEASDGAGHRHHAPRIGQHTAEIMAELGWSDDAIAGLTPG